MSNSGYVKIYGSILGSSVWSESPATRIVWITLLALADQHGRVDYSVPGLARAANVERSACLEALQVLSSPDPDDRSGVDDGVRITAYQGGWAITNYERYREMRSEKQIADAERQAKWREEQRKLKQPCTASATCDLSQESHEVAATVAVAVTEEQSSSTPSPMDAVDTPMAKQDVLRLLKGLRTYAQVDAWSHEILAARDGMHGPPLTNEQIAQACRDYVANGHLEDPSLRHFRTFLRSAAKPAQPAPRRTDPRAKQVPRYDTSGNGKAEKEADQWGNDAD